MNKKLFLAGIVVVSQITVSCAHNPSTVQAPPPTATDVRIPTANKCESPWTTWSEKGTVGGLEVLAHIRENLMTNNLKDPHINYLRYTPVDCSKIDINFRTADGTCNDLENPLVGAAGVAFGRNVAPEFIDKDATSKLLIPNPALISKEFFTRDEFKPVPFLNMLAASWIQFMNHDWLTHGRNMDGNTLPPIPTGDGPDRIVERTKENPAGQDQYKKEYGLVSANEATHWWDASQLYGSNQTTQNEVRSFSRGKMRTVILNGRELLPMNKQLNLKDNKQNQGYEVTGFRDNWWVGLSMLHHLFVLEHNSIADMLLKKHASWDGNTSRWIWKNGEEVKSFDEKGLDEQVFQTSRLVLTAILAKIHTVEWTPAILPNKTLKKALFTNWYGVANPKTWSKFLSQIPGFNKTDLIPDIKCDSYVICGIVGNETKNYGVPFSITEEFTSVYRLHSLLPEILELRRLNAKDKVNPVAFPDSRNDKSYPIMANYDLKDLYYSFGVQHPGQLVLNNFPHFMQDLEIPGHGKMDLGMVDIIRDRERGVPRYNQFRHAIGLTPIKSYEDFFPCDKPLDDRQKKILEKFRRIYGQDSAGNDNVDMIDLLVGTLAEEVRPKYFGFGETQFQIFILMASRRLMTDRFLTTYYRKEYYTDSGLKWIDDEGTLKQIIIRHMPELKPQMKGLETAFQPWNK